MISGESDMLLCKLDDEGTIVLLFVDSKWSRKPMSPKDEGS